jgi:hypothetical protein
VDPALRSAGPSHRSQRTQVHLRCCSRMLLLVFARAGPGASPSVVPGASPGAPSASPVLTRALPLVRVGTDPSALASGSPVLPAQRLVHLGVLPGASRAAVELLAHGCTTGLARPLVLHLARARMPVPAVAKCAISEVLF